MPSSDERGRTAIQALRQLLLLRHAKALAVAGGASDHARALGPEGLADAALLGAAMRTRGLAPEFVLVSSARRTRQTLEALQPWEDTPQVEVMDAFYNAPAETMLEALRQLGPSVRSAMVVAHNPGLHNLARLLADGAGGEAEAAMRADYPPACLTEFTLPGGWDTLAPGTARLRLRLVPRALAGV